MTEKEAVEILTRNGASIFDNKVIDVFFTDLDDADEEERTLYAEAVDYLIKECDYEFTQN